jgi:3-phytase
MTHSMRQELSQARACPSLLFVLLFFFFWLSSRSSLAADPGSALRGDVSATVETDPVPHPLDAADDPAIWIHPSNVCESIIIGTDKRGGLAVYDLSGAEIQFLEDGAMNNVDVRYNVPLGDSTTDIVAASNCTYNSIAIYAIDRETRTLETIATRTIAVGVDGAYGFCLYHSPLTHKYYAFVNDRNGAVEEWELFDSGAGEIDAVLVRSFVVGSQTEGMVTDDVSGDLYIGEEDVGIWKYGAEPDDSDARTLVDTTDDGGHLTADVEGLTLYYARSGNGYLIASSQGDDSYVIYDRAIPHDYVGTFRIVTGNGIDGTTQTDGIDVANVSVGQAFSYGMLIAQDNDNQPENQNFKLVPWDVIAAAMTPPLTIDTTPVGPHPHTGDLDGDGDVDLVDLAKLLGHYGDTGVEYADGDLDGDGTVDLCDLTMLLAVYGALGG